CDEGAKLIVTVDCGITAIDPIRVARERGVDVVVTDHHEWKERPADEADSASGAPGPMPFLPAANHIVHPRLPGGSYPNEHLCGAGVAFKLAWGVGQAMAGGGRVPAVLKDFLVEAMALAALGTIADVVPLVGENRILAHFGLGGLKNTKLVGLRALIDSADLTSKKIDSYHVGFLLAPRLNAAGRMGHARLAVEMLTTATEQRASDIATYLEQQNRQRQLTEKSILDAALSQVDELKLADARAIVVGAVGWHPGVIGIVASRLVDRFHRPSVVVAMDTMDEGGLGHGSGRSIDGFHLSKALATVGHLLESHGGHEMAAGLKVKCANFGEFRDAFAACAGESIDEAALVPRLRIDADAELAMIDESLVGDFARLGPFGRGNPKPLLRCRDLVLTAPPRRIGKTGDHLTLQVKSGGRSGGGRPMKAIAFGAGDWADKLQEGDTVHLCVQPTINEFNGYRNVELEVKDLQRAD
ncbi:MAG TPA: DHHA1 domain-containing protein, partial [Tepidisphaeraceae bacterium]